MRELLEAIERVRERIKRHESQLRQNEMLTRYALVDPILRALGWDTEDPEQVVPEFQTEVGRPDYILQCANLRIGVEAKRLGADEKVFEQAYLKALPLWQSREIRYYAITDGDRWILWDISKPRTQNPRPIVDIRLSHDNPGDAARQLLALWRPAMPEVRPAQQPVIQPSSEQLPREGGRTEASLPLPELLKKMQSGQSPPASIHFPDGKREDLRTWKDLLVAVAKWALPKLQQQKKLPLKLKRKWLITKEKPKWSSERLDSWWIFVHYSAKECVQNAIHILDKAEVSADEVFVTLGEGRKRRGRPPKRGS